MKIVQRRAVQRVIGVKSNVEVRLPAEARIEAAAMRTAKAVLAVGEEDPEVEAEAIVGEDEETTPNIP